MSRAGNDEGKPDVLVCTAGAGRQRSCSAGGASSVVIRGIVASSINRQADRSRAFIISDAITSREIAAGGGAGISIIAASLGIDCKVIAAAAG